MSFGTIYRNDSGEAVLRYTTVIRNEDEGALGILLFRDRVFWPCEKSE
jgi:hypothetical protein